MLNRSTLSSFTGTQLYHRCSPLFPKLLLTDGAEYVAENGGTHGAFWLFDAIGSYQSDLLKKHEWARDMQFWKLTVTTDPRTQQKSAVLECREDSGLDPVVRQEIEFTDFDWTIDLWVEPSGDDYYVVLLPSEH